MRWRVTGAVFLPDLVDFSVDFETDFGAALPVFDVPVLGEELPVFVAAAFLGAGFFVAGAGVVA